MPGELITSGIGDSLQKEGLYILGHQIPPKPGSSNNSKTVQFIPGKNDIGTEDFLKERNIEVRQILELDDLVPKNGPVIIQDDNPEKLQKLIFEAKNKNLTIIDDTYIDYGYANIGFPWPSNEELENGSKYHIIQTNIPRQYTEKISEEIQKVINKFSGFIIDYRFNCVDNNIVNKVIYDLVILYLQGELSKLTKVSYMASNILK